MTDQERAIAIRRTVRRVRGHWYRSGVRRRDRRERGEELADHLAAALADGRRIEDVTGPDLPRFAAEWARIDHPRPLAEPLLWAVGVAALGVGGLALLGPVVFGHDRTGFDSASVTFLGAVLGTMLLIQLLRWRRDRMTTGQAVGAAAAIGAAFLVVAVPTMAWGRMADVFVAVAEWVAWTLVLVGLASQVLLTVMKRTGRGLAGSNGTAREL